MDLDHNVLKGEFTFFYSRIGCPPLGESNLMGPKKSVEVKFLTVAFFGVRPTLLIMLGAKREKFYFDRIFRTHQV